MKVCVLVDRAGHPVLEAAARRLAEQNGALVSFVDVATALPPADADVFLLKSRAGRALAMARAAERRGSRVVNSAAATAACLDRLSMAERMRQAGLPFPHTSGVARLDCLIAASRARRPRWPIVVKSRRSRRGDLVRVVSSEGELRQLEMDWGREAVVVQSAVRHDGWEQKLWVIGGRIHKACRRAGLEWHRGEVDVRGSHEVRSEAPEELAYAAGAAFGLQLYGVDVLLGERGPVVVDVNPFPGFRSVPWAGDALAAHVVRVARRERCTA